MEKNYDTELYMGKVTIILNKEGKFPFKFGYAKAKLILENIDKIKQFVADTEATKALMKKVPNKNIPKRAESTNEPEPESQDYDSDAKTA